MKRAKRRTWRECDLSFYIIPSPISLPFSPLHIIHHQSYMTDDSTINPFYDEASWMETEELTKPEEEGTLSFQNTGFNEQAGGSITYRNTGFEEEEEEEGEEETELKESHWRLAPRHPTATASQF